MKVVRISALRTGRLYPQEVFLVLIRWLGGYRNHLTARRTGLYHCDTASNNVASVDGLKSLKHVERVMIKRLLIRICALVGLLIYTLQYDARCIQRQIHLSVLC